MKLKARTYVGAFIVTQALAIGVALMISYIFKK